MIDQEQNAKVISTPIRRRLRRRIELNNQKNKMASAPTDVNVGRCLRELRIKNNLSIRALAEMSALNVNTLSLIENGKSSPSVSTLQLLAHSLKVPITAFFETNAPKKNIIFLKSGQRPHVSFSYGVLEDLGAGLSSEGAEPFVVTLEPHADSGPTPIVHTGLEFVFCLGGCITYNIGGEVFNLEPGDSLLFEAYLPHRWQNTQDLPSSSLLILCSQDERDHPTERHFSQD